MVEEFRVLDSSRVCNQGLSRVTANMRYRDMREDLLLMLATAKLISFLRRDTHMVISNKFYYSLNRYLVGYVSIPSLNSNRVEHGI